MLYHSVMHACMQGLRLITAGHAAAYGPWPAGPSCGPSVCATRACVMRCVCAHGKTTAADAWVAAARHVGTSTSRHDPRSVSACVRDQGAAGRPARGGPGWALGVGGCILFLAGREAVDHARAAAVARGSVLYSMANADCRELKKRQQQANPSTSQVTYTAAAACLSTRKRGSHGVIL